MTDDQVSRVITAIIVVLKNVYTLKMRHCEPAPLMAGAVRGNLFSKKRVRKIFRNGYMGDGFVRYIELNKNPKKEAEFPKIRPYFTRISPP